MRVRCLLVVPVLLLALSACQLEQRYPTAPDPGPWDRIAQCESGGDWATNTGNGYYGGLQMDMDFWRSYAPHWLADDGSDLGLVAPRPDMASREQQIVAAQTAYDSGRGYSPWPTCGKRA